MRSDGTKWQERSEEHSDDNSNEWAERTIASKHTKCERSEAEKQ
jgi:hypothetical protein